MPIKAVCPSCGNEHHLADRYAFKTVECSQCATIFPTPEQKGPPPLPANFVPPKARSKSSEIVQETPVPAAAPTVKAGPPPLPPKTITPAPIKFEILPDEIDDEVIENEVLEQPPVKAKPVSEPKKKPKSEAEPKTVPEEELPADREPDLDFSLTETQSRASDEEPDYDDDDDYEDEDKPKKPTTQSGSKTPLLIGLAVVLLIVLVGMSTAVYFFAFDEDSPFQKNDLEVASNVTGPGNGLVIQPLPSAPNFVPEPKKAPERPKDPEPKNVPEPKKTPVPEPKKQPDPEPKKDPDPVPEPKKAPEPKKSEIDFAVGALLVNPVERLREFTMYQQPGESFDLMTNGIIKDVCAAAGGKFLLVNCNDAKKLHIVDTGTAAIVKTITIAQDALAAGGMDHFVVVTPSTKMIERYSLETLSLEKSAKLDVRQKIIAAVMGSRTAGPVVLGGPRAQNNASKMSLMFVDVPTLKEVKIEMAEGEFGVSFGTAAQLRISPNGQLLGAWFEKLNPTGLQTVRLEGNSILGKYLKNSVGSVVPGNDGESVFTGKGKFGIELQNPTEPSVVIPAASGEWYVRLETAKKDAGEQFTKIIVVAGEKSEPVAMLDSVPGFDGKKDPFQREVNQMPTDRRVWLIQQSKVLITIPPSANKLQFFPVGR